MESYFYPSNLLPASPVEHTYRNVWIRDLYYIGICSPDSIRMKLWRGMVDILDRYEWKLSLHSKQKPKLAYEYMHVRYAPDGTEIHEGWRHKQWDAIANWLEVCLELERLDLASLLVDYLLCIRYYKNPSATAWEDTNIFDSYSLAAVISALQKAKYKLPHQKQKIDRMVQKGINKLYSLLPYASRGRKVCLSLLGVIWPCDCAGPYKQDIIHLVKSKLMREPFGFIRYQGDVYDGEGFTRHKGTEIPWLLGDLWMAKIEPDNPFWINRAKTAYAHFGCMPEAYFPETMKPNRNTPLLWAEAIYRSLVS